MELSESLKLQDFFFAAIADHPCSAEAPWNAIVGFDEFAPGSQLQVDNARKCMNAYMIFVGVGACTPSNVLHMAGHRLCSP